MRLNVSFTDGVYGGLSDSDINEQITSLTEEKLPDEKESLKELLKKNRELIDMLEQKIISNK